MLTRRSSTHKQNVQQLAATSEAALHRQLRRHAWGYQRHGARKFRAKHTRML